MNAPITEHVHRKTVWTIHRYANDEKFAANNPYSISTIKENVLLNEGITELLKLLTGDTATAYDNSNARLGVGDSSTAENATHTGLQAATNKLWKGMEATYPQIAAQTVTFRAVFTTSEANYSWQEFTVTNAADDSGDNLNRKISDQGTKTAGQTWTLDLAITFS